MSEPGAPAERPTSSASDQSGIDLAVLDCWLAEQGFGTGLHDATVVTGGTQNVMLRFVSGNGDDLVLRHPPLSRQAGSDQTLLRELRTLALLDDSRVPHPRVRAACRSTDVLGSVFYVMDTVDGFNPADGLPVKFGARVDWQHRFGIEMAVALAALAEVPVDAAVEAGFKSPEGWLRRQPARWRWQLESYPEGPLTSLGEAIATWLEHHTPAGGSPGLMHGDYHLGNVLIRRDGPAVAAIVDWELATLGDPLLDLAHLLIAWPVGNQASSFAGIDAPGLPNGEELKAAYFAATRRPRIDLTWYLVLACYRLGVLVERSYVRSVQGLASAETGERLHAIAVRMFAQADGLITQAG